MKRHIRGKKEGSLSQRSNGNWRAQISQDNGRRISRDFKTKPEAQTWLHKMHGELENGFNYQGSKVTLSQYLQQWLETARVTLRLKTSYQYEQIIKNHILPHLGSIQLKDLSLLLIEQLYSDLVLAGVGSRTIRIVNNILHRSLDKAVRYGLLTHNPSQGAAVPRYVAAEMLVLDTSQVGQFLISARGSYYEALYHLAVTTGMRQAELFGLKWTDLELNNGILRICRQVERVDGHGWRFVEPKTKAGRRTIKLGEGSLHVLRLHKERQEIQKAVTGERWQENGLIFPSRVGTPGDPSNLRIDFRRVLEKANLPQIRFHDLRHTAASIMLNHGVPVIVASKRLGHSKPSVTLDIYAHLYVEMQDEAAKIIDDLVTPIEVVLPEHTDQRVSQSQK